jgi:hypothetical protein
MVLFSLCRLWWRYFRTIFTYFQKFYAEILCWWKEPLSPYVNLSVFATVRSRHGPKRVILTTIKTRFFLHLWHINSLQHSWLSRIMLKEFTLNMLTMFRPFKVQKMQVGKLLKTSRLYLSGKTPTTSMLSSSFHDRVHRGEWETPR